MKKLSLLTLLVISIMLTGCAKEAPEEEVYKDDPSLMGVIKEIEEESLIINSKDRVHSGDLRVARLTEEDVEFDVGDTVMVYYNGEITEADPPRIKEVYSIAVKEKADIANVVDQDSEEGDTDYFYSLPILTSVKGEEERELNEKQSAFVHDLISSLEWDKGAKEDINEDYSIMEGSKLLITFNSETHVLNDKRNDISIQLQEELSNSLRLVLENEL